MFIMSLCIKKLFIIICRQIENASHWAFFWRIKIVVNLSITCSMIPKALDHYSCALVHAALFKRESPLTFWSDPYRAISESHGAGIKGGSLLLNSLMLWKQRWWKVCSAQGGSMGAQGQSEPETGWVMRRRLLFVCSTCSGIFLPCVWVQKFVQITMRLCVIDHGRRWELCLVCVPLIFCSCIFSISLQKALCV